MAYDDKCKWRVYLGVLTESTTKRNQRWFHVYVSEFLPMVNGDVSPEEFENSVEIENIFTESKDKSNAKITKTIYADYLGMTSSMSVPTMTKGMQVLVVNYGNTDRYYWVPFERDDHLKTFENIRISALDEATTNRGSTSDQEDITTKHADGITDDNSYYIDIDTKYTKRIILRTSGTDGELYRYGLEIDAKANTFRIWDEPQPQNGANRVTRNQIVIESFQNDPRDKGWGKITLQNAYATSIVLNDFDMDIFVPRNLNIKVGANVTTTIIGNKTESVTGAVNHTNLSSYTHQINNFCSITVKDNMTVQVIKNFMQWVGAAHTLTVIGNYTRSAMNMIITAAVGYTFTTSMLTQTILANYNLTITKLANFTSNVWKFIARKQEQPGMFSVTTEQESTPWRRK